MPSAPSGPSPMREVLQNLRLTIGRYLDTKSADVEHREVIKELYDRTNLTGISVAEEKII